MRKKQIDFTPKAGGFAKTSERQEQIVPIIKKDHVEYAYVEDLQDMLGISRGKAYKIIKLLQEELPDKGTSEPPDRISRKILKSKVYGESDEEVDDGTVGT